MTTVAASVRTQADRSEVDTENTSHSFERLLPVVRTHAQISFRDLPYHDRQEAIAESIAAAYMNFHSASQRGKVSAIRPSMLARFAVLHARGGRHVGGPWESKRDVLSRVAQRRNGFRVHSLPNKDNHAFNCMTAGDQPVWHDRLLHDRRTPPAEQAAFRIDWSAFMAGQTDRTRQIMGMLAAGYRRSEVADALGVTPPAITQRMKKAKREWEALLSDANGDGHGQPTLCDNENPSARERVSRGRHGDRKPASSSTRV